MLSANHLVLIGPTGVGKSLIGTRLAKSINWPLLDIDELICANTGVDISWIFDCEGEQGFRARELAAMQRAMASEQAVIAAGAGLVTTPKCRDLLSQDNCWVVYLRADTDVLYERLSNATNRPMLNVPDKRARLAEMFAQRAHWYESLSDYTIDCGGKSSASIVDTLLAHAPTTS